MATMTVRAITARWEPGSRNTLPSAHFSVNAGGLLYGGIGHPHVCAVPSMNPSPSILLAKVKLSCPARGVNDLWLSYLTWGKFLAL